MTHRYTTEVTNTRADSRVRIKVTPHSLVCGHAEFNVVSQKAGDGDELRRGADQQHFPNLGIVDKSL